MLKNVHLKQYVDKHSLIILTFYALITAVWLNRKFTNGKQTNNKNNNKNNPKKNCLVLELRQPMWNFH